MEALNIVNGRAYFKSNQNKFHAGGREDLDVRMLGEGIIKILGRPFVLEIENPKRTFFT